MIVVWVVGVGDVGWICGWVWVNVYVGSVSDRVRVRE